VTRTFLHPLPFYAGRSRSFFSSVNSPLLVTQYDLEERPPLGAFQLEQLVLLSQLFFLFVFYLFLLPVFFCYKPHLLLSAPRLRAFPPLTLFSHNFFSYASHPKNEDKSAERPKCLPMRKGTGLLMRVKSCSFDVFHSVVTFHYEEFLYDNIPPSGTAFSVMIPSLNFRNTATFTQETS